MVGSGLLAFVLVAAILRSRDATVAIAVARHDIAAGQSIAADDVEGQALPADSGLLGALARLSDVTGGAAGVAAYPIRAGEPITTGALRAAAAPGARRAMSISVERNHAAGGELREGDRVDVIAVDKDTGAGRFVLRGAEVIGVASKSRSGGIGTVTGSYYVTVAVTAEESLALAEAVRNDDIEVLRSTGAPPAQVSAAG